MIFKEQHLRKNFTGTVLWQTPYLQSAAPGRKNCFKSKVLKYHDPLEQEKKWVSQLSFSDASKMAKCAANYIRTEYEDDKVDVRINVARTKLSPQKTISIPRLELDAFLMSVRLVKTTLKELNIPISTITYFTDSMIVLHWTKQPSNKYRDYVAHRISDIQSELNCPQDQDYKVEI